MKKGLIKNIAGSTLLCYMIRFVHFNYWYLILFFIIVYAFCRPSSLELFRKTTVIKRRSLQTPEEKFASLRVTYREQCLVYKLIFLIGW
jgi:hypothetical protein